jgi:hypothetical protein
VRHSNVGDALATLLSGARHEVLLAAPFVTVPALTRLLEQVPTGVELALVTRWRLDELAVGVSDAAVYEVICARGGSVRLLNHLHAKYYRSDEAALVGSANITATALGWSGESNLELLTPIPFDSSARAFERVLLEHSAAVSSETAALFLELQAALRLSAVGREVGGDSDSQRDAVPLEMLLPRQPVDVWWEYADGFGGGGCWDNSSIASFVERLGIPRGISSQDSWRSAVGSMLWAEPAVQAWYRWTGSGRRFGEVSARMRDVLACDGSEAEYRAQNLIRTLCYYLPHCFVLERPRHTEILRARRQDDRSSILEQ